MSRRTERLNDLMREVIAEIVARELNDPRLDLELLSITEVNVAPDMQRATIRVSVLGSDEQREAAVAALNHSRRYIHRLLTPRLSVKRVPELEFVRDDRLEHDQAMLNRIRSIRAADDASHADAADAASAASAASGDGASGDGAPAPGAGE